MAVILPDERALAIITCLPPGASGWWQSAAVVDGAAAGDLAVARAAGSKLSLSARGEAKPAGWIVPETPRNAEQSQCGSGGKKYVTCFAY